MPVFGQTRAALAELLLDRYSAPRVYLQGFCVEEE